MSYVYLDSSAAVKLIQVEAETTALRAWLVGRDKTSSSLVRPETMRAVARGATPDAFARVDDLVRDVALYPIDSLILDRAGRIGPPTFRTLDAIHLATALRLQPELDAFVTYDLRLADAARAVGLHVFAPA